MPGFLYKHLMTESEIAKSKGDLSRLGICAFCQQKMPTPTVVPKTLRKLMKNNNPDAYMQMAALYKSGDRVFQSDTKSLEMRIRAAELGHVEALVHIGQSYTLGVVVEQDELKALEFYEVGAKKGSAQAHHQMAMDHRNNGNIDESINHLKVAASAGYQQAWIF